MNYCPNCGEKLNENADVCIKCGKLVNQLIRTKVPGRGSAVTSLIFGIIAITWTLMAILNLDTGLETLVVEYYYESSIVYFVGYYIGFTLFSLTPGIISLVLGLNSYKKQKTGVAKSGIILSSISLTVCLIILIRFIVAIVTM